MEKELIKIQTNEKGQQVVSARDLYFGLGMNTANYKRWSQKNIVENEFFIENKDWVGFITMMNGNKTTDYAITLDFAKHLIMLSRTKKAHEYREYLIKCEEALRSVTFRLGDKKHQLDCMEFLQDILPDEFKQDKVSYVKANTVVNKVVSDMYGFPKMLKKKEMNEQMLEDREKILDDYIKLFEILQDNSLVTSTLKKKYTPKLLE